jgi:hypothetical protein
MNLSMIWRGGAQVELPDIIWSFAAIGLLTAASFFAFNRLAPDAGNHLHQNSKVA